MAFVKDIRKGTASVGTLASLGVVSITVTWDKPFPDTSYLPLANVESSTGLLQMTGVLSKTTSTCTFAVKNISLTNLTGTLDAIGIRA